MKLTKTVPAHIKTVEFNWCKKDWMLMSPKYRKARMGMTLMDSCFWCGHVFSDGETMSLAQPKSGLNKVLCCMCADTLLDDD